jgi:hypothetical protein
VPHWLCNRFVEEGNKLELFEEDESLISQNKQTFCQSQTLASNKKRLHCLVASSFKTVSTDWF